jgi:hypothetical protein
VGVQLYVHQGDRVVEGGAGGRTLGP